MVIFKKMIIMTLVFLSLIAAWEYHAKLTISTDQNIFKNISRVVFDDKDKAALAQKDLESEFTLFSIMPGAVQANFSNKSAKPEHAMVSANYSTNKNYTDIREFYLKEAAKNGWTFIDEKSIYHWGKDFGGMLIQFRKGEYKLSIQYADDRANYGGTYSIDLSWGF